MKIGLIGYGKMGKMLEAIALERGHSIVYKIEVDHPEELNPSKLSTADVILEFTHPGAAVANITAALKSGRPVVSGTTGWSDRFEEVAACCRQENGGLFYASNFSPGVHLFLEMNRKLARLMASHPEYKLRIEEIHHLQKKDAPSGTALSMVKGIEEENPAYSGWLGDLVVTGPAVPVTSIREGSVPGTHEVRYTSPDDLISLKHEAFSRRGFAFGAILAAEFMAGRKGLYTLSDLFDS